MPKSYEDRARTLVAAAQALETVVFEDLDEVNGGTAWLHGQLDVARNCLITDYLIASLRGVSLAALSAAYAIERRQEASTSSTFKLHQRMRFAEQEGLPPIWAVPVREFPDRRTELEERMAGEHALMHLGQTLDRLGACVVAVAGLPERLLTLSWSTVRKRIRNGLPQPGDVRATQSTEGYERQAALIADLKRRLSDEDADALDWLWQLRHTTLHRAEFVTWNVQIREGRNSSRAIHPYPRQPDWAFHESMASERAAIEDLLLMEDPNDVLEGMWSVVSTFAAAALGELSQLWIDRRADPTLIVQPGKQWPAIGDREVYRFEGFGKKVATMPTAAVNVSPDESRRIAASKIFDADREVWETHFPSS